MVATYYGAIDQLQTEYMVWLNVPSGGLLVIGPKRPAVQLTTQTFLASYIHSDVPSGSLPRISSHMVYTKSFPARSEGSSGSRRCTILMGPACHKQH
jgi:hypothetical protein